MIATVTFNPSLDYVVSVEAFAEGQTNRAFAERLFPGGKGINVSIVLSALGTLNTAFGFAAGFVGDEILRQLNAQGIRTDFVRLKQGVSRINVKLRKQETEINGKGPDISADETEQLLQKLDALSQNDTLVLAGSIPGSVPKDIYSVILKRLQQKRIQAVVDAEGDLLRCALPYRPFLVKPNRHELEDLFHVRVAGQRDVVYYAKKLQEEGAKNVLVSLGAEGAVLLAEDGKIYTAQTPAGKLVNAVGAGDSMVAGFLKGWQEKQDAVHALRMGVAAGSASAFSENLATRGEVEALYPLCDTVSEMEHGRLV